MHSNDLITILYQISNSFNNEPIGPFIKRMMGLGLLMCCVAAYAYLTIRERKILYNK